MSIAELLARVGAATGPDREMDCALACAVGGFWAEERAGQVPRYCYENERGETIRPGNAPDMLVPTYTASLDAALALVERKLPGWGYFVHQDSGGCGAGILYPDAPRVTPGRAGAATPALSVLAALLKALASQEAQP